MPTYTETLFDPLEAWIENRSGMEPDEPDALELRLLVSRMLLEHAGRARQGFVPAEDRSRPITLRGCEEPVDLGALLDELSRISAAIREGVDPVSVARLREGLTS
jgi:hypothetical protein